MSETRAMLKEKFLIVETAQDDDSHVKPIPYVDIVRSCSVEFIGVGLFVFIGSLSFQTPGVLAPAFAHGITIALLIIALGHISGGHFNPAVTLGIAISGKIHFVLAILYVICQLLGGFVGALFVRSALTSSGYMAIVGGTTNINSAVVGPGQAIVTEIILTFILVQSVLNAAIESGGDNVLAPLGIGFSVLVDILAGGAISGASMNPARSFGPAAAYSMLGCTSNDVKICPKDNMYPWDYHYVHWIGPLIGGALAAVLYKLFFAKQGSRWILN